MTPLVPFGGFHHATPHSGLSGFGQVMHEIVKSIAKPGKAPEHRINPSLPKSITKPGAHPQHKKVEKSKDKDHTKKESPKHSDKKKSESKSEDLKKPTKII